MASRPGCLTPAVRMQKLSSDDGTPTRNACDQSQAELQDTAALTRTIAAMARNLPASTTKLLEFELADSYKGLPTKHKEFDTSGEKSLISDGLLVLFSTAMQHLQCMDDQGPEGKETRNMHASIARVALGLLSDLAANDEAVRRVLQSHVDKERPWQGGVLWGGASVSTILWVYSIWHPEIVVTNAEFS